MLGAGVEMFTFFAAIYCISHRSSSYRKRQRVYIIFGGVLLVLVTISVMSNALWGQYIWIEDRNYFGFYGASEGAWYNILGFVADATTNILADGLLVRPISSRHGLNRRERSVADPIAHRCTDAT
jgi:hypothetical protein